VESARLEHCNSCGGARMCNYLYRTSGKPLEVYVRCDDCGAFVARYGVSRYTSNKSYQDLIRVLGSFIHNSGRRLMRELESFDEATDRAFAHVRELVARSEDPRIIERIMAETAVEEDGPDES